MTSPAALSCDDFDREAADLALGHLGEPRRSDLMHHAANCPGCDRLFADLVTITDRMLELTPAIEPPTGFETRILSRMSTSRRLGRARRLAVAGAAALLVAVVAVVTAVVTDATGDRRPDPIAASIVSRGGEPIGTAELDLAATPRLIVTMEGPSDWSGVWTCEVLSGGTWVDIGSWTADEVTNGVWAAGLPPALAEPTAMRILGESGAVIATAAFTGAAEGF